MMLRKIIAFLILIPLFAVFASAANCDVSVTPAVIDIDNDLSVNAGRVTVFGKGTASSFNGNTKVEVNCNVAGALPGANQDIVIARIAAYTQTTLSYTDAYCTYKSSSKDIDYKVSTKILLHDVVCSGGYCFSNIVCNKGSNNYATVTVKASSKSADTTPMPITPVPTTRSAPSEPCGGLNQKPCTTCPAGTEFKTCIAGCMVPNFRSGSKESPICWPCPTAAFDKEGNCVSCGHEEQKSCGGNCLAGLTVNSEGKCVKNSEPCGGLNQKPCTTCPAGTEFKTCIAGCMVPNFRSGSKESPICWPCPTAAFDKEDNCVSCGHEEQKSCGGNCLAGLTVNSEGKCVKQTRNVENVDNGDVDVIGDEKELRFGLDWKWSLIGVPYGAISSEDHSCISKIYFYNKEANKYQKIVNLKDKNLIGKGLWAMRSTTGVGGCTIKYAGKFLASQTIELKKGWNLISVQTEKGIDTLKSTSCKITGGPYMYSGFIEKGKPQGYMKRDKLNFGSGYWIKVADNCKLTNEEDEEAPPAPPESSESGTITPQGGRGRRYVGDAG